MFGLRKGFVGRGGRGGNGFVRIREDVKICEIVWIEG